MVDPLAILYFLSLIDCISSKLSTFFQEINLTNLALTEVAMMPNQNAAPERRANEGISNPALEQRANREISSSTLSEDQIKRTEAKTGPPDSEQLAKKGNKCQILKQLSTWNEWPESARKRLKSVLKNECTSSPSEIVDQLKVSCVSNFLLEKR